MAAAWDDGLSAALERLTGLSEDDIRQAHRTHGERFNDTDERLFYSLTQQLFFQYANDPDNQMTPTERGYNRGRWFDEMERLTGFDFDNNDFWEAWHREMDGS